MGWVGWGWGVEVGGLVVGGGGGGGGVGVGVGGFLDGWMWVRAVDINMSLFVCLFVDLKKCDLFIFVCGGRNG